MISDKQHLHEDPSFSIAEYDTSDDASVYADPERLEARHEQLEDHLAKIGALPVKLEVSISTKAQEIHAMIDTAKFRSHLKEVARDLTLALARKEISNDEYQTLFSEYQAKVAGFTHSTKVVHESVSGPKIPKDEPDWRQRQMKDY